MPCELSSNSGFTSTMGDVPNSSCMNGMSMASVKSEEMAGHEMHSEYIYVTRDSLQRLIDFQGRCTAVGTTSVRTLESLYYIGIKLLHQPDLTEDQLFTLCGQMRALYSRELLESNPINDMLYRLEQEIELYKDEKISVSSFVIEPAEDVEYTVISDKKRANVEFHFTLKGAKVNRLPEEIMLEEDDKREFKIIGWRAHEKK